MNFEITNEFRRCLKEKQRELGMGPCAFANYLGFGKAWLFNIYNEKQPPRPLRETTMYTLNTKIGVSYELMDKYNESARLIRKDK